MTQLVLPEHLQQAALNFGAVRGRTQIPPLLGMEPSVEDTCFGTKSMCVACLLPLCVSSLLCRLSSLSACK